MKQLAIEREGGDRDALRDVETKGEVNILPSWVILFAKDRPSCCSSHNPEEFQTRLFYV